MIAALVTHGHLPTCDDLEFAWLVNGSGDLVFDALYMDPDLDPSAPASSEEEPPVGSRMKTAQLLWYQQNGAPHMVGVGGIVGRDASNESGSAPHSKSFEHV